MSEIHKQAGKYDAVIGTQHQSPMYGAVMGGIDGLKNRFDSVEDVSQKARILEEALQYEEEGKQFIIDIFLKRENQENLIKEILLRNPSYSEFLINIIFEQQPATILKVSAIKIWNEFRAKNIKFLPDLSNINLANTNLSGANLSSANLSDADLSGADLSGADLSHTVLNKNTKIDEKWQLVWDIINNPEPSRDLRGVDLSDADLSDAYLWSANLTCANNLSGVNLSGADLSFASLSGTNLIGVNLSSANLIYASLSGANLSGANLSGADLSGADLSHTVLNENTKIDEKWKLIWDIINNPQ